MHKTTRQWLHELKLIKHETPFALLDTYQARANVNELKRLLPRVKVYYAVKSNDDERLIRAIDDTVDGYEIASLGEWRRLEALGIAAPRVSYSNPVKAPAQIEQASEAGIRRFSFDGFGELEKLIILAPGAQVYARVRVADDASTFPLSRKFGMAPKDVQTAMRRAFLTGLLPTGLAFHVGSQTTRPEPWTAALKLCGALIKDLGRDGIPITEVNIGGGLPVPYAGASAPLRTITAAINRAIDRYIPPEIRIVAEPGRAIAASCMVIATTIIGREPRENGEWLFLDMGAFQGLLEPLEVPSLRYPVFTDRPPGREGMQRFTLTGPSCDAFDALGSDYELPGRLRVGDRMYIGMAGAYSLVYGSCFNGFAQPAVYYVPQEG